MKNKIIKNLTVGISCLMLTLSLSVNVLNNNSRNISVNPIHIEMESPEAL